MSGPPRVLTGDTGFHDTLVTTKRLPSPTECPPEAINSPSGHDFKLPLSQIKHGYPQRGLSLHQSVKPLSLASSCPTTRPRALPSLVEARGIQPSTAPVVRRIYSSLSLPPERKLPFGRIHENSSPEVKGKATEHENSASSLDATPDLQRQEDSLDRTVDTQLLLEKLAARRSRSDERKEKNTVSEGTPKCVVPSEVNESQIKARNLKCDQCRALKRRCEKLSNQPTLCCRPCRYNQTTCTYYAVSGLKCFSQSSKATKPKIQACNPQDTSDAPVHQNIRETQRARLTSPSYFSEIVEAEDKVADQDIKGKEVKVLKRIKTHATPAQATKRLKGHTGEEGDPVQLTRKKQKSLGQSEIQSRGKDDPGKLLEGAWFTSTPIRIRSEATTSTADRDNVCDLSSHALSEICSHQGGMARISSDRPTFSELSELRSPTRNILDSDKMNMARSTKNPSIREDLDEQMDDAMSVHSFKKMKEMKEMTVSEYCDLDSVAKRAALQSLIHKALKDEAFLTLCKDLETEGGFSALQNRL